MAVGTAVAAGATGLAHPGGAQRGDDLTRAELSASLQGYGCPSLGADAGCVARLTDELTAPSWSPLTAVPGLDQ